MEGVPVLAAMMQAMGDALPDMPFGKNKAPLGTDEEMRDEMSAAGFVDVRVEHAAFQEEHENVRSLWRSFDRGGAPCVLLRKKLGDEAWAEFSSNVVAGMERAVGTGPLSFGWTANYGIGHKR
jgi:hypothetical protein